MLKGKCKRCGRNKLLTKHSLIGHHKAPFVMWCRECQDKVHKMPRHDKKWKKSRNRK